MDIQESNYYDINMAVLKKYRPDLWEKMRNYTPSFETEVFFTHEGKANLMVRLADGRVHFLHDKNDPEKEIPLFLEMISEDADGVVLLIGMGLGYTPAAILERRNNIRYLAVFDLSPDAFDAGLRHLDLTEMLTDPRLILSLDPEPDIEAVLSPANLALQLENIHDLKHIPTFSLDQKAYETLSKKVFACANQYNLGGGALLGGGKVYTQNRVKNMLGMYHNCIVQDLMGQFKGFPAILVAGGPSLDKNIQFLKEVKDNALILAVDSVLPALVSNGISPDFMTAIDPYELIYEKFADALPHVSDTSLIASCWVAPKVSKMFSPERIFWTFAGRNMESWLMQMMNGTLPTGGASTVAHLNLVAAILMGCSPIVFVGQDLSYTTGASHALHTSLNQNRAVQNLLKSRDMIWVEEINGGKVPTDRKMLNFKLYFEDLIRKYPGVYINATFQGARIEGTEPMDLEEVIRTYCQNKMDIGAKIANAVSPPLNPDVFVKNYEQFIKDAKSLLKEIEKADTIQKRTIRIFKKNKGERYRQFADLPLTLQKKLNDIDKCHEKIDAYTKLWGILDEVTMTGLQKSERQKFDIEKLAGDPDNYVAWMIKSLERLNYINKIRKVELKDFSVELPKLIRFIEVEQKIQKKLSHSKSRKDDVLTLMQHYFSHGEYALLETVCKKYDKDLKDSLILWFYRGCLSLLKNKFQEAENLFRTVEKKDSKFEKRIRQFRMDLGDSYIGHADFFNGKDENTTRRMLIKGLRYSGGQHPQLIKQLTESATVDIQAIETAVSEREGMSDNWKIARNLGKAWCRDIMTYSVVRRALGNHLCALFFKWYGNMLVVDGEMKPALNIFNEMLIYVSNNPEYHLLRADVCFAVHDFDSGVASLSEAVRLDRKYAGYWENIGDNLLAGGNFNDALAAYEQNLMALPENKNILKKIAKCYLGTGQVKAAEEALLQLRKNSE